MKDWKAGERRVAQRLPAARHREAEPFVREVLARLEEGA
jgi:hypothetical protein